MHAFIHVHVGRFSIGRYAKSECSEYEEWLVTALSCVCPHAHMNSKKEGMMHRCMC